jgi:hypothetical protein
MNVFGQNGIGPQADYSNIGAVSEWPTIHPERTADASRIDVRVNHVLKAARRIPYGVVYRADRS